MSLLDIDIKDDYLKVLESAIIQHLKKYGLMGVGIKLYCLEQGYATKVHNLHKYDLSYGNLRNYILRIKIDHKSEILNVYITRVDKFKTNDKTLLVWKRKDGADSVLTLKDLVDGYN